MPFDRLVRAVDQWAGARGRADVFAQIGDGAYEPRHMRWERFLSTSQYRLAVGRAGCIVGHAGMGTIITAMEFGKPVLVLPRLGSLCETRNDHQVGTARLFRARGQVVAAMDECELISHLDRVECLPAPRVGAGATSDELVNAIKRFIVEGAKPGGQVEVKRGGLGVGVVGSGVRRAA